ncbi:NADH-quinone oxidoreductase subunit K [Mycolicibacterium thermoresistibile]
MTRPEWFLVLGVVVFILGATRLVFTRDLLRRVVAMNVAGSGTLLVLISVAARSAVPDPVLHALVLTGIVITVSVTALALLLVRLIERGDRD